MWNRDSMTGSVRMGDVKAEFRGFMKVSEAETCNMNLPSLLETVQAQPWKPSVVKKRDLRCSRAIARRSAVRRKIYGWQ